MNHRTFPKAINSRKDCKNRPFDGLLRLVMLLSRASDGGAQSGVEEEKKSKEIGNEKRS
jgi:hypothetical protein